MTRDTLKRGSKRMIRRGRPSTVPAIEERLGLCIEHHVMAEMAAGRSLPQIAAALKLSADTIRRHLRLRGYRIERNTKLVLIERPLRPGRSGAAR